MGRNKEAVDMLNWGLAEYPNTGTQADGKSRSRSRDKNLRVVLQIIVEIVKDHRGRKDTENKEQLTLRNIYLRKKEEKKESGIVQELRELCIHKLRQEVTAKGRRWSGDWKGLQDLVIGIYCDLWDSMFFPSRFIYYEITRE